MKARRTRSPGTSFPAILSVPGDGRLRLLAGTLAKDLRLLLMPLRQLAHRWQEHFVPSGSLLVEPLEVFGECLRHVRQFEEPLTFLAPLFEETITGARSLRHSIGQQHLRDDPGEPHARNISL
jgi:hypothetical protein